MRRTQTAADASFMSPAALQRPAPLDGAWQPCNSDTFWLPHIVAQAPVFATAHLYPHLLGLLVCMQPTQGLELLHKLHDAAALSLSALSFGGRPDFAPEMLTHLLAKVISKRAPCDYDAGDASRMHRFVMLVHPYALGFVHPSARFAQMHALTAFEERSWPHALSAASALRERTMNSFRAPDAAILKAIQRYDFLSCPWVLTQRAHCLFGTWFADAKALESYLAMCQLALQQLQGLSCAELPTHEQMQAALMHAKRTHCGPFSASLAQT